MSAPIRLTVLMTHPVQYLSPWFRDITARAPELDLTVLYGALPPPEAQGAGFGRPFTWDVPLLDGYAWEACLDGAGRRFDSDSFWSLDVPDIGARLAHTRPDVVLVPGWHSALQVRALAACRRRGIPTLYRGDSTLDSGPRGAVRPLWALKTRSMLRQFDVWLAVGTDAGRYLRHFGVPEPLIVRSPHAVDVERFAVEAARLRGGHERTCERRAIGAADEDFVVLFAGKCVERKRPLDAVRAVAALGPSAVLLAVGDGPLAEATRAEAARLGVRLAWRGFQNQSAMPRAFAAADCLLVPSRWESWGLIVNEAMASGLPCVATDAVAAARDLIVDGETGYTAPVGDIAALAARLGEVRVRLASHAMGGAAPLARARTCDFAAATAGLVAGARRAVARRRRSIAANPGRPRLLLCGGHMVGLFGLERVTFDVLEELRQRGWAVHGIVNPWASAAIAARLEGIGASWTTGAYQVPMVRSRSPRYLARLGWDVARTSGGLLRDAYRFRASHVLVPDFGVALRNLPGLLALRLVGCRVVLEVGNPPVGGRFYARLWRWLIAATAGVMVANSRFTAAAITATGVPARKVRMVYNAEPRRRAEDLEGPATKDPNRIIYVGQLIPPKGADLLLDAVAELVRRGHDVRLDVVGDIDGWEPEGWRGYRARLRARGEADDLRGRVRFLGVREDVPALLAASAVHCCPSFSEGFGLVNLEAKIAGLPSVVFPGTAMPELVTHQVDGWICASPTVPALVEGLEYFLADRDRLADAGRRAAESRARFGRDAFVAGWLEALTDVA